MDKAIVYGLLILFLGIAIGYSISDMATIEESPGGMKVPVMSVSFGSIDENNTVSHRLSYNILLYNSGDEDVYVNSVEPIFGEHISKMVVTENNTIAVDRTINANSSVEISGQVELKSTGLKAVGSIIGYNISSTETIYNQFNKLK
ncbi:hypothetical protein [Methanococcoides burtonii]|uniref:Uncharacterized protein n=1 Tax=Methanococcoides burtonii (strain DSM 6242 / NBRC 107633 / OCM 468 / ACE-M) TaxID=259564 RepID=Q12XT1_METBU|nr:hypothetical protein [Methanococcoides burtonii]ABE51745.1 Hypothetical protein Mbur_0789 [Methanococcoides burtonii DSM 6242]